MTPKTFMQAFPLLQLHAKAAVPFSSFTVHVSEDGMADNEVTYEMTKLYRNVVQANLIDDSRG